MNSRRKSAHGELDILPSLKAGDSSSPPGCRGAACPQPDQSVNIGSSTVPLTTAQTANMPAARSKLKHRVFMEELQDCRFYGTHPQPDPSLNIGSSLIA